MAAEQTKALLQTEPKIEVIGAGFGRTGTRSTQAALERLLDGPCYHMFENMEKKDMQRWLDAYGGKPDWNTIFKHKSGKGFYKATLDYPACGMYAELMERFPDAKVLLTVRDPAKWYESVSETIWSWRCPEECTEGQVLKFGRLMMKQAKVFHKVTMLPGVERSDREGSIKSFNAWVEKVKATVPPEKLLVFDVKEGWGPLCKFLNKPVPDEPFPNINDREEFVESVKGFVRVCRTIIGALTFSSIGLVWGLCSGNLITAGVAGAALGFLLFICEKSGTPDF
mmetsp:Transcript_41792/g.77649  ORF Transcript_41792/g.77649 Transcript_41792/m.77649 type:complete len:282 (+) Transcript_41792:53-898(+)